jgi:DNA-binding XRE family transcriptional regulator
MAALIGVSHVTVRALENLGALEGPDANYTPNSKTISKLLVFCNPQPGVLPMSLATADLESIVRVITPHQGLYKTTPAAPADPTVAAADPAALWSTLRVVRATMGLTEDQMAAQLEVSRVTVRKLERLGVAGAERLKPYTTASLCKFCRDHADDPRPECRVAIANLGAVAQGLSDAYYRRKYGKDGLMGPVPPAATTPPTGGYAPKNILNYRPNRGI